MGVVVLVIRSGAGEFDRRGALLEKADQLPVELFAAVVEIHPAQGEGQVRFDVPGLGQHPLITLVPRGPAFGPAGAQTGVGPTPDKVPGQAAAAVRHAVHFLEARTVPRRNCPAPPPHWWSGKESAARCPSFEVGQTPPPPPHRWWSSWRPPGGAGPRRSGAWECRERGALDAAAQSAPPVPPEVPPDQAASRKTRRAGSSQTAPPVECRGNARTPATLRKCPPARVTAGSALYASCPPQHRTAQSHGQTSGEAAHVWTRHLLRSATSRPAKAGRQVCGGSRSSRQRLLRRTALHHTASGKDNQTQTGMSPVARVGAGVRSNPAREIAGCNGVAPTKAGHSRPASRGCRSARRNVRETSVRR